MLVFCVVFPLAINSVVFLNELFDLWSQFLVQALPCSLVPIQVNHDAVQRHEVVHVVYSLFVDRCSHYELPELFVVVLK